MKEKPWKYRILCNEESVSHTSERLR